MTVLFVSPAEPRPVVDACRRAGIDMRVKTAAFTEQRGVDFLWRARGSWHGIQRKELSDLFGSMTDGRLSKELGQMRDVANPMIIIERRPQWTGDGELMDTWGQRFTFGAWCGMIASLADRGIGVIQTDTIAETAQAVVALVNWSRKASHDSLLNRPSPGSSWGVASSRDWAIHMLQGIPGIGPGNAAAVYDHFGQVPMRWTCSRDELLEVSGIGPKRADRMMEALDAGTNER